MCWSKGTPAPLLTGKIMTREEAIEVVRKNLPHLGIGATEMTDALRTLIPEFAKIEDERIRKELKEAFEAYDIESTWNGIPIRSIFAWLEKQKEPKHDATDAKSERVIKAARSVLNNWLDGTDCPDVSGDFVELEYAIREYDGYENQQEQKPVPFSCGHENGKPTEWDNLQEEFRNINEAFERWKERSH
jgi:hypothetical protein